MGEMDTMGIRSQGWKSREGSISEDFGVEAKCYRLRVKRLGRMGTGGGGQGETKRERLLRGSIDASFAGVACFAHMYAGSWILLYHAMLCYAMLGLIGMDTDTWLVGRVLKPFLITDIRSLDVGMYACIKTGLDVCKEVNTTSY